MTYRRNPNGLYPTSIFPEDYGARPIMTRFDPPLRVHYGPDCYPRPLPRWHGYTGAIGHFHECPMPGKMQYVVHGETRPQQVSERYIELKYRRGVDSAPPGIPYTFAQLSAMNGPEMLMRFHGRTNSHPMDMTHKDGKMYRFDKRDFHFV